MNNREQVTDEAISLIKEMLVNSNVESFGVSHQTHFIEFRNEQDEDIMLSIDSDVSLYPPIAIQGLNDDEYKLLAFNHLNLKRVVDIMCTPLSDIEIYFQEGYSLKISGTPRDESIEEPWQISNQQVIGGGGGKLIVALAGNGFAIWK